MFPLHDGSSASRSPTPEQTTTTTNQYPPPTHTMPLDKTPSIRVLDTDSTLSTREAALEHGIDLMDLRQDTHNNVKSEYPDPDSLDTSSLLLLQSASTRKSSLLFLDPSTGPSIDPETQSFDTPSEATASGTSDRDYTVPSNRSLSVSKPMAIGSSSARSLPTVLTEVKSQVAELAAHDRSAKQYYSTTQRASDPALPLCFALQNYKSAFAKSAFEDSAEPSVDRGLFPWDFEFSWDNSDLLYGNQTIQTSHSLGTQSSATCSGSEIESVDPLLIGVGNYEGLPKASQLDLLQLEREVAGIEIKDSYDLLQLSGFLEIDIILGSDSSTSSGNIDYWLGSDNDDSDIEEYEGVDTERNAWAQSEAIEYLLKVLRNSYRQFYVSRGNNYKGSAPVDAGSRENSADSGAHSTNSTGQAKHTHRGVHQPPQQHHSSSNSNVSGDGGTGSGGSGSNNGDASEGSQPSVLLRLACPFYRSRPSMYPKCGRTKMKSTGHLKAHLRWEHREKYCPKCFMECKRKEKNSNIRNHKECLGEPRSKPRDYVSDKVQGELDQPCAYNTGDYSQWQHIFKLIFPNESWDINDINPYMVFRGSMERLNHIAGQRMVSYLIEECCLEWNFTQETRQRLVREAIQKFILEEGLEERLEGPDEEVGENATSAGILGLASQPASQSGLNPHQVLVHTRGESPGSQHTSSGLSQTLSLPNEATPSESLSPVSVSLLGMPNSDQPIIQAYASEHQSQDSELLHDITSLGVDLTMSYDEWQETRSGIDSNAQSELLQALFDSGNEREGDGQDDSLMMLYNSGRG